MSINSVVLSGNLTKDPEQRSTQNGKSVTSFTIATNEGKDKVEFHNCVAWEKTAEVIAQYCKKGNKVAVQGRLQTRKWEKDGITRYATEIVVMNVDLPAKSSSLVGDTKTSTKSDDPFGFDEGDSIPF